MTHSLYWIRCADHTNLMTQGYIGVSGRFDRRMWEHSNLDGNRYLKFAIKKHGWDNMVKTQLLISTEEYCLNMERKLRPEDKIGWNIVAGGGKPPSSLGKRYKRKTPVWNVGVSMSIESAEKVRQGIKKLWQDPEYRKRILNARVGKSGHRKGIKHTAEAIERMRLVKIGKSSKKKGIPANPKSVQKMIETFKANPWSCPHCNKIGFNLGAGNRWHFDNCKERLL